MDIRTAILGNKHPDTIVTMHNIAELYIVMEKVEEATAIQHKILKNLDVVGNIDVAANSRDPRFAESIDKSLEYNNNYNNNSSTSSITIGESSISEYMDKPKSDMSARDKILHGTKAK